MGNWVSQSRAAKESAGENIGEAVEEDGMGFRCEVKLQQRRARKLGTFKGCGKRQASAQPLVIASAFEFLRKTVVREDEGVSWGWIGCEKGG